MKCIRLSGLQKISQRITTLMRRLCWTNMTLSTSASSVGRNVIFSYVLSVRKNLPISKLNEFQSELYKEIVLKACQVNKLNEAFNRGLYYTFVYHNKYGEKLAEFIVNKKVCDK